MYDERTPSGFTFSSVKSGLKNNEYDLALIVSEPASQVSALYTKHKFAAAPVIFSKKNSKNKINALIVNSQIANSATGKKGYKDVLTTANSLAKNLKCSADNILVASTGIIGIPLEMDKIILGINECVETLLPHPNNTPRAICMRDKYEKKISITIKIDDKEVVFFAMAKGTSSVHPNMATLLCFIFTDANIEKKALNTAFKQAMENSFNRISIDNHTSTNDSAIIMANGQALNKTIKESTKKSYDIFTNTLNTICQTLAKMIVLDGEGSTKIATVNIENAKTKKMAYEIAETISISNTVKILLHSNKVDPIKLIMIASECSNDFDYEKATIKFNNIVVYKNSNTVNNENNYKFNEALLEKEQTITIDCGFKSSFNDHYIFSDLTNEYIEIVSSYYL